MHRGSKIAHVEIQHGGVCHLKKIKNVYLGHCFSLNTCKCHACHKVL